MPYPDDNEQNTPTDPAGAAWNDQYLAKAAYDIAGRAQARMEALGQTDQAQQWANIFQIASGVYNQLRPAFKGRPTTAREAADNSQRQQAGAQQIAGAVTNLATYPAKRALLGQEMETRDNAALAALQGMRGTAEQQRMAAGTVQGEQAIANKVVTPEQATRTSAGSLPTLGTMSQNSAAAEQHALDRADKLAHEAETERIAQGHLDISREQLNQGRLVPVQDPVSGRPLLRDSRTGAQFDVASGKMVTPPIFRGKGGLGGASPTSGGAPPLDTSTPLREPSADQVASLDQPSGGSGVPGTAPAPTSPVVPQSAAKQVEMYQRSLIKDPQVRKDLDDVDKAIIGFQRAQAAILEHRDDGTFGPWAKPSENFPPYLQGLIPGAVDRAMANGGVPALGIKGRTPEQEKAYATVMDEANLAMQRLSGVAVAGHEAGRVERVHFASNDSAGALLAKATAQLEKAQGLRDMLYDKHLPQYVQKPERVQIAQLPSAPGEPPPRLPTKSESLEEMKGEGGTSIMENYPAREAGQSRPLPTMGAPVPLAAPSFASGISRLRQLAPNFQQLGQYGPLLQKSLAQGQDAFDANVYSLAQTDPQFLKLITELNNAPNTEGR